MTPKPMNIPRGKRGFTLVEALASLLVITLVFTVVATAAPTAARVYREVVAGSNAQVLLSTAAMRLREELGLAHMQNPASADPVTTYISGTNNADTQLVAGPLPSDESGTLGVGIYIQTVGHDPRMLVSEADAPDRLYVTFDKLKYDYDNDYDSGIFTIEHLQVKQRAGESFADTDHTLAEIETLEIRSLPTGP